MGMMPSATLAGVLAAILTVAAVASRLMVDVVFRAFGG
jgi:hypothetical protein